MKKLILLIILSCFSHVYACSNVVIQGLKGTVISGRTMEYAYNTQSRIIAMPKNHHFTTKDPQGQATMAWKNRYGYVFLDAFHEGYAVDGMNQQGLSFSYLYLPGYTQYPKLQKTTPRATALPYDALGNWILGNFKNTAEVAKALKSITVFARPLLLPGHGTMVFPLHAMITDATGKSIVVEFLHGKLHVYDNAVGVLTNSPPWPYQVTNLRNYVKLSPYNADPIMAKNGTISGFGMGSGAIGLPGDSTPPSRFVRLAFLKHAATPVEGALPNLSVVEHILNAVDIVNGSVRAVENHKTLTEETQWTVYKDLTHKKLYYRSYGDSTLRVIDLNAINFNVKSFPHTIKVDSPKWQMIDKTNALL